MSITLEEVITFTNNFFHAVGKGATAAELDSFFLYPNSRIFIMDTGLSISMQQQCDLHLPLKNEIHRYGKFNITQLSDSPCRARATGSLYWQAEYRNEPQSKPIQAQVGEDWIVERTEKGDLKFVMYMNPFIELLPDSAPLDL